MIRRILLAKDPKLRHKSRPVGKLDKKTLSVIKDLQDTLKKQTAPPGVGLAAPQLGVFLRIFLVLDGKKSMVFVNPEIVEASKKTNDPLKAKDEDFTMEGCLSLPNVYGPVVRSATITVRYQTPRIASSEWLLVEEEKEFKGFTAQVIQHELDHLEGILFVDRLLEQKRGLFEIKNNEWHEISFP
ncbi:MAG: peptide deformylase [bacterium]|nr:peptide deformylase [bacterium]